MNNVHPPKWPLRFLKWYCKPALLESILGDLEEQFDEELETLGPKKARRRFTWNVIRFFRPGIIGRTQKTQKPNKIDMYRNYLKIAIRVFRRERSYSLINLFGLILGFTCCLTIYLFINDELSYDKMHTDADRIYRLSSAYMREGRWEPYASNAWRTGEVFATNFDEVEELVRIRPQREFIMHHDKRILEEQIAYVDANFFNVFSFPLLSGDRHSALDGAGKVVINETTAKKYFGDANPMGQILTISDSLYQLQVAGVMQDMPPNSHFHFDILISPQTQRLAAPGYMYTSYGWDSQRIYVKLKPDATIEAIEEQLPNFINTNLGYLKSDNFKLFFQPLLDIHLMSNIGLEMEPNGDIQNIYIFSFVAVFILFIACINYINLTTARSLRRAKEVGMRKVLGAQRGHLINQFLLESFVMTFMAMVFSFFLTILLLPQFNAFANKMISSSVLFQDEVLLALFGAFILIAFIAGGYPSLVLSSFKAGSIIKSGQFTEKGSVKLRKALVVVQFTISIGLIAATLVVFKQLSFMQDKDLGVNEEYLVTIPLQTMDTSQFSAFKTEATRSSLVHGLAYSNMRLPGWINNSTSYRAQDVELNEEVRETMKIVRVDEDFFDLMQVDFVGGRNFSSEYPAESTTSVILNEAAIKQLGWHDPVGKWLMLGDYRLSTVGVVKDFHIESLHRKIPPTIFVLSDTFLRWAYVRIDGQQMESALAHLEEVYGSLVTNRDFEYTFVSDDVVAQYESEKKFTQVFEIFTLLAIIIASLGTFGLISFAAERKTKEIGIRKVLGASLTNLTMLLTREFLLYLIIASVIAWPVTYYFMDGWINDFIYHTTIGFVPFIVATIISLIIAISTTVTKSLRAAAANPTESLRDE